ncbi:hypothetical protein CcCBS67573_g07467 [Chytriomyces confervae]|uniref:L domain-like protein n=1 Tax=Chytriomyces confervae TaxID=246404 RepID=A0A507EWQ1_9FUNG|nr:hypothetical protein CcCBS67573_g07467 [Chytriomyces confervae]
MSMPPPNQVQTAQPTSQKAANNATPIRKSNSTSKPHSRRRAQQPLAAPQIPLSMPSASAPVFSTSDLTQLSFGTPIASPAKDANVQTPQIQLPTPLMDDTQNSMLYLLSNAPDSTHTNANPASMNDQQVKHEPEAGTTSEAKSGDKVAIRTDSEISSCSTISAQTVPGGPCLDEVLRSFKQQAANGIGGQVSGASEMPSNKQTKSPGQRAPQAGQQHAKYGAPYSRNVLGRETAMSNNPINKNRTFSQPPTTPKNFHTAQLQQQTRRVNMPAKMSLNGSQILNQANVPFVNSGSTKFQCQLPTHMSQYQQFQQQQHHSHPHLQRQQSLQQQGLTKQELYVQYCLMTGYQDAYYEDFWSDYFGLPVFNAHGSPQGIEADAAFPAQTATVLATFKEELSSNQLQGNIPTEFGLLTSLTWLSLWGNQLTGTIPTELGRLTRLQYVNHSDRTWPSYESHVAVGVLHWMIFSLFNQTSSALYNNQLTGTVPTELGRLASLTWLSLNGNQLSGTIPTELGQLTGLTNLELNVNRLTGTIPTELGRLTSLQFLRLNANNLSGKFPCELGNLKSLTVVNFAGNALESTNFNSQQLSQSCASTLSAPALTASSTTTVAASSTTTVAASSTTAVAASSTTTVAASNPGDTTVTSFNPGVTSLNSVTTFTSFIPSVDNKSTTDQQQTSAPIIGEVAGAAVFLCVIVAICVWFRRKSVKKESPLRASAMDEGQATFGTSVEIIEASAPTTAVAAALGDFLVAGKLAAPPEKVGLFDRLEELSHDRKLDRTFEASDKGRVPDSKVGIVSEYSGGASDKGQHTVWISPTELSSKRFPINQSSVSPPVAFALSNETNLSSSHHIAPPINPKDWSKDEFGQWMLERSKDQWTSAVDAGEAIVSWLKIDTVGQILLFEEAIAELQRQSAQQSALAQENPPSYE